MKAHRIGRPAVKPAVDHLAGLREERLLATLPAEEQEACRRLWAEVGALRARALGPIGKRDPGTPGERGRPVDKP